VRKKRKQESPAVAMPPYSIRNKCGPDAESELQSKTLRDGQGHCDFRQVVECASPLALSAADRGIVSQRSRHSVR